MDITGLDSSPILWTRPIIANDVTSSYVSVAKYFQFTGTTTETTRLIDGIGQVLEYSFAFGNQQEQFDFLSFFEDRKSSLYKFWIPVYSNTFELKSYIIKDTNTIYIKPSLLNQSYQGYERIWLLLKDGTVIVRKITDVTELADGEQITVDTPIGRDIHQSDIAIFGRFILVRFGADELEFDYTTPYYATTKVKFYELVDEYNNSNTQNQFAELYDIEFPENTYRYTSFYKDINYNYNLYTAVPMKRSRIETNTNFFLNNKVELVSRPTEALKTYVMNSVLLKADITITRLDLVNSAASVIFKGTGGAVALKDNYISIVCNPVSSVFDYKLPRNLYQSLCNHILFSKGCGVNKGAYAVAADVTVNGNTLTSDTFAAKSDGYFIGGYVTNSTEYRLITNHVGNTLTLQAPFNIDVTRVTAYPGCDGSPATCKNKFNNLDNFLGFPYIASKNPTVWGVR